MKSYFPTFATTDNYETHFGLPKILSVLVGRRYRSSRGEVRERRSSAATRRAASCCRWPRRYVRYNASEKKWSGSFSEELLHWRFWRNFRYVILLSMVSVIRFQLNCSPDFDIQQRPLNVNTWCKTKSNNITLYLGINHAGYRTLLVLGKYETHDRKTLPVIGEYKIRT